MNDVEQYVLSLFRPMLKKGYYGHIMVKVQDGQVSHIHEGKDHKPPTKRK